MASARNGDNQNAAAHVYLQSSDEGTFDGVKRNEFTKPQTIQ
ncbi:hypothetical protein CCACVL1_20671 [Corchorus capsularis]|uniref:Uncharacterized protein n=1 Tax=Corchorus capsularis TaxID=210143 RepID=A0A1R3HA90_COCAP|nr:hypothetical protein CCACVL1_20671 [Corchorus capsularis]